MGLWPRLNVPGLEFLQRLGVYLSGRLAPLGIMGSPIQGTPETPKASPKYCTKEFKEGILIWVPFMSRGVTNPLVGRGEGCGD